jgi:type II secretory pathway pseudopilin PulG
MLRRGLPRKRPGAQDGFTLVELLVATASGIVVIFAVTTILIATTNQTRTRFTEIDATRQARTALATIENELHSACVDGSQAPPIQTGSDASNLAFLSYTGTAASPTPVWHVISFSGGTLTDYSYPVAGTAPNWTQGASYTSRNVLLTNVSLPSGVPSLFRYFAYQWYYNSSDSHYYWAIPDGTSPQPVTGAGITPLALATPLSASAADSAVEVTVDMLVGPSSESLNNQRVASADDPVQDAISLRLTTPPDYSQSASSEDYGPCE